MFQNVKYYFYRLSNKKTNNCLAHQFHHIVFLSRYGEQITVNIKSVFDSFAVDEATTKPKVASGNQCMKPGLVSPIVFEPYFCHVLPSHAQRLHLFSLLGGRSSKPTQNPPSNQAMKPTQQKPEKGAMQPPRAASLPPVTAFFFFRSQRRQVRAADLKMRIQGMEWLGARGCMAEQPFKG